MAPWTLLFLAPDAHAAARTFCFEIRFEDDRDDCPGPSTNGRRETCHGDWSNPVGLVFELWDADGSDPADDELIGTWRTAAQGTQCLNFEWENSGVANGESDPDVYVKSLNTVRAESGGATIRAADHDGDLIPALMWRSASVDCAGACNAPANLLISTDPDDQLGRMAQALDSAQRALMPFVGHHINEESTEMRAWVFDNSGIGTPCGQPVGGCTWGETRSDFGLSLQGAQSGQTPPHEAGHLFQKREFGQNGLKSICNGGHGYVTLETDSCATTEGFAQYIGALGWWQPNDTGARPEVGGFEIEEADPHGTNCATASQKPLQVARWFWDLDDAHDDAEAGDGSGDDTVNRFSNWILNRWDVSPDGLDDREDFENDENGVNVWDWEYHAALTGAEIESMIDHNCLDGQDP